MRPALLVAIWLTTAGACATGAEETPAPPVDAPTPPIAGGYAPASDTAPGYAEAEELAIRTIYERDPQRGLVTAKKGEVQVVAGLNYRFEITMTGGTVYDVTVYRNLQGGMSVTGYSARKPSAE